MSTQKSSKYPDLFVLRHGQTDWNVAGRYQGRCDSSLTGKGRQQAKDQARLFGQLDVSTDQVAVYCSPQGRAVATAEIALEREKQHLILDDRLQEISLGEWEGQTNAQILAGWPEEAKADFDISWHFSAPGGESYIELENRLVSFLSDLTGPSIVVTHGVTCQILRGLWLGMSPNDVFTLSHLQGCIYHLRGGQETCVI